VVATEWLDDAVTAGRLWRTAGVIEERVQMLSLLARELARHHDRGVIQPDMHLENFMVRGREVFASIRP
jgi:tRNA A-37 threonylcarbamoyl transferase component Bud32